LKPVTEKSGLEMVPMYVSVSILTLSAAFAGGYNPIFAAMIGSGLIFIAELVAGSVDLIL
jgi:hypothetical protein